MAREPTARPRPGLARWLTRRSLARASLTEILDWLGQQKTEAGISRKEALGLLIWSQALDGNAPMIRLMFDYLVSKPPLRTSTELTVQPMAPFTADEAIEAQRHLERCAAEVLVPEIPAAKN